MELLPPIKGLFRGTLLGHAPELTSESMNNVRPRDSLEKRLRIGQRPGLDKWGNGDLIGGDSNYPVVALL
ncbi:hypothetical protein LCGC14_2107220, partial [marine sediment metagenome]